MNGSDPTLLAQMASFWAAYDAAVTNDERANLMRQWLLEHGGEARVVNGQPEIVGGIYPVRV